MGVVMVSFMCHLTELKDASSDLPYVGVSVRQDNSHQRDEYHPIYWRATYI